MEMKSCYVIGIAETSFIYVYRRVYIVEESYFDPYFVNFQLRENVTQIQIQTHFPWKENKKGKTMINNFLFMA